MDNINTTLINDLSTHPYNPNVAYTNSWISVAGANFPLFAQASYITNADDFTITLSAANINIDLNSVVTQLNTIQNQLNQQLGQNGVVYADNTSGQVTGSFTTFQVVSTCQFSSLSAKSSTLNGILSQQLSQGFTFNAPATSFALSYGSVLAYKS
jgi:hypothetical protein